MLKSIVASLILVSYIFFFPPAAKGQLSVEQVLNNMVREYERGVQNIDDYTVETDMYTAQYKKEIVNGRPTFKSRVQIKGFEQFGNEAVSTSSMGHSDFYDDKIFNYLKENAEYKGMETIGGARTHILFVPELTGMVEEQNAGKAKNVHFYIDAEKWVLHKMAFDLDVKDDSGQTQKMNSAILFQDYRNIEGMYMPFRTVMEMEGLDASISEKDREEARKSMAELRQQLDAMPEQQRKMMERMMGPQIKQLENMLAGEKFEIVIEVQDVKVNTGLSDDLFN